MKKLFRSRRNAMIAGVCGGLGEYLDIDATLIRLLFAASIIFACGTPILFYILAVFIIPVEGNQ